MAFDAGYSKTPLVKKLGLKGSMGVWLIAPPEGYADYLGRESEAEICVAPRADAVPQGADFIQFFSKIRRELQAGLKILRERLAADGMLWVSWPKKALGVETDIVEDAIRSDASPLGFVDVKVCAVDATWSGLKLVIRKELREN